MKKSKLEKRIKKVERTLSFIDKYESGMLLAIDTIAGTGLTLCGIMSSLVSTTMMAILFSISFGVLGLGLVTYNRKFRNHVHKLRLRLDDELEALEDTEEVTAETIKEIDTDIEIAKNKINNLTEERDEQEYEINLLRKAIDRLQIEKRVASLKLDESISSNIKDDEINNL